VEKILEAIHVPPVPTGFVEGPGGVTGSMGGSVQSVPDGQAVCLNGDTRIDFAHLAWQEPKGNQSVS
jgi:hypothetical protein